MNYFYSEKSKLRQAEIPQGFADHFPLASLHRETSTFFLSDGVSVGAMMSLRSCRPEQRARLGRVVADFLRSSPLLGPDLSVTVTVYVKTSPAVSSSATTGSSGSLGSSADRGTPRAEEATLRAEGLISIVATCSPPPGASLKKLADYARRLVGLGAEDQTGRLIRSLETTLAVAAELEGLLKKNHLMATRLLDPADMIGRARFFWTADGEERKDAVVYGEDGSPDVPASFASGFSVSMHRLFWKEGDAMRMMASMRTPPHPNKETKEIREIKEPKEPNEPRENSATNAAGRDDSARGPVASVFGLGDMGTPGLSVFLLSAGGPRAASEADAVSGSLVASALAATWRTQGRDEGDEDPEGEDEQGHARGDAQAKKADKQRLSQKGANGAKKGLKKWAKKSQGGGEIDSGQARRPSTVRLAAVYVTSVSWRDSLGRDYASFREPLAVSSAESGLVKDLSTVSGGGDWHVVDTMWLESLYALTPGSARLGTPAAAGLFDVSHVV